MMVAGAFLQHGAEVGSPSVVMHDRRSLGSFWRAKMAHDTK